MPRLRLLQHWMFEDDAGNPLPRPKGGADLIDIKVSGENPYPDAFPADQQQKLADRYAAIFEVLVKHSKGVGRDLKAKPAYEKVLVTLETPGAFESHD